MIIIRFVKIKVLTLVISGFLRLIYVKEIFLFSINCMVQIGIRTAFYIFHIRKKILRFCFSLGFSLTSGMFQLCSTIQRFFQKL